MGVRRFLLTVSLIAPFVAGLPARAGGPAPVVRIVLGSVSAPLTRTVAVPPGAILAGVSWDTGDAEVRVGSTTLDRDGFGTRPGTEPYWIASGTASLTLHVFPREKVSGLSVDFVSDSPSSSAPPSAAPRTLPRLGDVVTRAGWGADERLRSGTVSYARPVALVVHHTVSPNDYTPEQAASYVRAVYTYHTRSRGYADVGYNLLLDRFGTVYEGRYGDFTRGVVGAHTMGFNTGTLGISLLGNFETDEVPDAATAALERIGAWGAERWAFDPRGTVTLTSRGSERFPKGARVTVSRMPGHRDLGRTACPGRYTYAQLPTVRAAAWRRLAAVFSAPVVTGSPVRSPRPVHIEAALDHTAAWTATISDNNGVLLSTSGKGRAAAISWDGRLPSGLPAWPGTYYFRLTADDGLHGPSEPVNGTFEVGLPSLL